MATHIKVVKTKNKNSNDGSISSLYYTYPVKLKTLLKQSRESFSLKLSLENYCSSRLLNTYYSLYTWLPASYLKSSKLKVNWSSPWSWTEARWHFHAILHAILLYFCTWTDYGNSCSHCPDWKLNSNDGIHW